MLYIKRPALQNKRVGVLQMAFRARKVLGTSEKRARAQGLDHDRKKKENRFLINRANLTTLSHFHEPLLSAQVNQGFT